MRTVKLYAFAIGGIPIALYSVVLREWLAAGIFGSVGLACLMVVLDRHVHDPPQWFGTVALLSFGLMFLFLIALVLRSL